jgi:hypothetical protein
LYRDQASPSILSPQLFLLLLLLFLLLTSHILSCVTSFLTCSFCLDLGLPLQRLPFRFIFRTLNGILISFILKMCPYHLISLFTNLSFNVFIFKYSIELTFKTNYKNISYKMSLSPHNSHFPIIIQ